MGSAQFNELMVGMSSSQGARYQAEMESQGLTFSSNRPAFVLTQNGTPVRSAIINMGMRPDGTMGGMISFMNMHDQGMIGFQRRGPDYEVIGGSASLASSLLTLPTVRSLYGTKSALGRLSAASAAGFGWPDLPDIPIPDLIPNGCTACKVFTQYVIDLGIGAGCGALVASFAAVTFGLVFFIGGFCATVTDYVLNGTFENVSIDQFCIDTGKCGS